MLHDIQKDSPLKLATFVRKPRRDSTEIYLRFCIFMFYILQFNDLYFAILRFILWVSLGSQYRYVRVFIVI